MDRGLHHERGLAWTRTALGGSGAHAWARLVAGHLRGGSRQLHDGDCGVRPAGPHAALVIWRALHLSIGTAAYGVLAAFRGRVSRESRSCLSRREQWTGG